LVESPPEKGPVIPAAAFPPEPKPTGRSLKTAVITALVLLVLIVVMAFLGTTAFFFLVAAVVLLAQFELLDGLIKAGRRPVRPFALACGLGMLVVAYFERPQYLGLVLAATMVGAFALALRPDRGPGAMTDVAWTVLSVAWITGGGAAATMLLRGEDGLALLISFVLITALDDIGAFFAGTSFGRHKMAPSISPAKSWEGFAGGMATALAGGALFGYFLDPLRIVDGVALGAIAGLLGPVGDLVESMAKREIGIKDSSGLLPGHGGFLDRLDAIIFVAPAAFIYLRFIQ
jgi:phosphatidate cytidylyltransferase